MTNETMPASIAGVPMPPRIAALPRDRRGYPVPWFVQWQNGEPSFPHMNPDKWRRAVRSGACWVCGQPLGRTLHFVIGPMCAINRVTTEPPVHHDCALYSVQACPFLANPRMRRLPDHQESCFIGGLGDPRNPGTVIDWTCRDFATTATPTGPLIEIGAPTAPLGWWHQGRAASGTEIAAAFADAARLLQAKAIDLDGAEALPALNEHIRRARALLPGSVGGK